MAGKGPRASVARLLLLPVLLAALGAAPLHPDSGRYDVVEADFLVNCADAGIAPGEREGIWFELQQRLGSQDYRQLAGSDLLDARQPRSATLLTAARAAYRANAQSPAWRAAFQRWQTNRLIRAQAGYVARMATAAARQAGGIVPRDAAGLLALTGPSGYWQRRPNPVQSASPMVVDGEARVPGAVIFAPAPDRRHFRVRAWDAAGGRLANPDGTPFELTDQ